MECFDCNVSLSPATLRKKLTGKTNIVLLKKNLLETMLPGARTGFWNLHDQLIYMVLLFFCFCEKVLVREKELSNIQRSKDFLLFFLYIYSIQAQSVDRVVLILVPCFSLQTNWIFYFLICLIIDKFTEEFIYSLRRFTFLPSSNIQNCINRVF